MRHTLSCWTLIASLVCCASGCNSPRETIPVFNTTSGTTGAADDLIETDQTEVSLIDYDGLQQTIAGLAGQVVVVDIWSTSCIPCMQEFHHLVELSEKYPERLSCISLNVDYMGLPREKPESHLAEVEAFLEKKQASRVKNFVASEPDTEILEKFEVESMPAILVIDSSGKLVTKATDASAGEGGLSYEEHVIPQVEALLAAEEK